ncbi:unnamed protein product [Protopolystoma xenopodis]|uniref:Uncharacterized protein n=1 Tax=Protopolystoma xenopodis TaxID=117903 RepID=A0A3S4ZYX9_9PLAT|nr:unnamed protein product [Protopolystoma xenopodis]
MVFAFKSIYLSLLAACGKDHSIKIIGPNPIFIQEDDPDGILTYGEEDSEDPLGSSDRRGKHLSQNLLLKPTETVVDDNDDEDTLACPTGCHLPRPPGDVVDAAAMRRRAAPILMDCSSSAGGYESYVNARTFRAAQPPLLLSGFIGLSGDLPDAITL